MSRTDFVAHEDYYEKITLALKDSLWLRNERVKAQEA